MTMLSPTVTGRLLARDQLTARQRDAMFELLSRHFDGVTRDRFDADLAAKNWVLLLEQAATLAGFSTMLVLETSVDGRPITTLYSGDTIVDPSAWSSAALPREWIGAVWRLRDRYDARPLYWLLLTSGFRTYRLLSTFWQAFHPRFDEPIPPSRKRLLDALAADQYGDAFDAATGLVRFDQPQVLRDHLAGVPDNRRDDPHVAFFAAANPGHAAGDELACLCELTESNLTRAGRRVVFGPGSR